MLILGVECFDYYIDFLFVGNYESLVIESSVDGFYYFVEVVGGVFFLCELSNVELVLFFVFNDGYEFDGKRYFFEVEI